MTWPWCAYPIADCKKPEWRCKPQDQCGLCGRPVYRDKYTRGGHHHQEETDNAQAREPSR